MGARVLRLSVIGLLAMIGAISYAVAPFKPITDRSLLPDHEFFFSAGGYGYPAIQSNVPLLHGLIFGTRLDSRGRLTGTNDIPIGMPVVSFSRRFIGWPGITEHTGLLRYGPDGRRTNASPSPIGDRWLSSIANDGSFTDDHGYAYTSHAKPIRLPITEDGDRIRVMPDFDGNDPRYLLLRRDNQAPANRQLYLYDTRKEHRYNLSPDLRINADGGAILYHAADRFVIVPDQGQACVLNSEGETLYQAAGMDWRCGEDGTVWRMEAGKLTILRWRTPQPKEYTFPVRTKANTRFWDIAAPQYPGWAAAWNDGEFVALAEMRSKHIRRLTFYRRGKAIRYFDLTIARFSKYKNALNQEHIAFTQDGRYLSWIADTGRRTRVLTFRVR